MPITRASHEQRRRQRTLADGDEYQDQAAKLGEVPPNSATNRRCGSWRGKQWPSLTAKSRRQERRSGERCLRASGFQQRRSWGGKALCAWVPSIKYPTPPGLCDWNCGQNVNMEPRRAAAPRQSHRPEAPRLTASVTASLWAEFWPLGQHPGPLPDGQAPCAVSWQMHLS